MTDRPSTHGHDCWGWGSKHYECAVREIERLAAQLTAAQQRPVEDGCHCGTCTCNPNMTPAVRFDLSPAQTEGAIREHLIRLGWTPPDEAEALRTEVERLKPMTAVTMGVGRSDGSLFVHGDYDSIKAAQALVFRAERLEEALKEIRNRTAMNLAMRPDPVALTALLGDIHQIASAAPAQENE